MTTASTLGNWGANRAAASLVNDATVPLWLALHLTDPNVLDPGPTEVAGGGYERQPITFATVSGRGGVSNLAVNYAGMPAATINFLAVWTAVAAGFLVFCIDTSAAPLVVLANGYVIVPVGDVALAF